MSSYCLHAFITHTTGSLVNKMYLFTCFLNFDHFTDSWHKPERVVGTWELAKKPDQVREMNMFVGIII